jgi:hypothetical protein
MKREYASRYITLIVVIAVAAVAATRVIDNGPTAPVTPLNPVLVERPVCNIPVSDREKNWAGGSCTHASTVMMLRWCGMYDEADYHRATYSGGEYMESLAAQYDKDGLDYVLERSGNIEVLQWAIRTRRVASITWMGGAHMLNLVDLTDTEAAILDNNAIDRIQWVPRERFESEWKAAGGDAIITVNAPCPPLPAESIGSITFVQAGTVPSGAGALVIAAALFLIMKGIARGQGQ